MLFQGLLRFSLLALLLVEGVFAQTADSLSVEDLWRQPKLANITMSRNGRYFAATMPINGRMNLAVVDLETRNAVGLTQFPDFDVISARWVGNDRLLFSLGNQNSPTGAESFDGGGLFVINRDGKDFRRLSPTVKEARVMQQRYRAFSYFRRIPDSDDEIIASGNMTSADSEDLYRLNVRTGRFTLLTVGRPAEMTHSWIMDSKLVPRVVVANIRDTLTEVVYYRKDEHSPWAEIWRYDSHKGPTFVPLAFDQNEQTLQVAYSGGRDTMAVYRFDPATKSLGEMIAQHPKFDMGADGGGRRVPGVIIDPLTDKLIGYHVEAAKPETVWLDEKYAAIQAGLDKALPGRINSFSRMPEGKRFIVSSYSDTLPMRWYMYEEEKRTLEEIGSSRPWLDGKLVAQQPFTFKTRDGLEIGGYYFLPPNAKPGAKLPTVVHIHGGPFARADTWGRGFGYMEGQLFASRGYAVIVPNFRITPGIGVKNYYAGFGTVGRQMSDDHEDALQWGIELGFVDPARVCISGASYGGYAALQALVRSSEKWRCAVAGLAVTDYKFQLTAAEGDTGANKSGVTFWKYVLGETDLDAPIIKTISPVFNAAQIKQPVFLYAGADDIRVPLRQISDMADQLTKAGNPPKAFVIKAKEGHGFGRLENRVDLYNQILTFLSQQLGNP